MIDMWRLCELCGVPIKILLHECFAGGLTLVFLILYSHHFDDISEGLCEKHETNKIHPGYIQNVGQADSKVTLHDFPNRLEDPRSMKIFLWRYPQTCMFDRTVSLSQFSPVMATRVGEASNPGPQDKKKSGKVCLAVCNPTAILQRKKELLQLDCQIILLSETSATKVVQSEFSHNIKSSNFRIFFGLPVVPKRQTMDGRDSLRGEAIGTAIMTSLPSRLPFEKTPNDLLNSCRVNSAVIRMGGVDILFIAIYGYPYDGPDSKRCNDYLLARTYQYAISTGMLFIIGGDFNIVPQKLPAFQAFKNIGTVEAFEIAGSTYHGSHEISGEGVAQIMFWEMQRTTVETQTA